MRKKIVKVVPFSQNVEKVFYADGSWGLRGTGSSPAETERIIPDQGRTGNAINWQDSMDGAPASPDEIDEMLAKLRPALGGAVSQDESNQFTQPLPQKGN